MPNPIPVFDAPPASANDLPPIAPVLLVLANLLKRSGNVTYHNELGLSSVAWRTIARLGEEGPMTQTELADRILLDKGQLSRVAVDLENIRLIARISRTRRTMELRLRPEGRKVFAAIQRISRVRHRALLAGISPADIRLLYKTLAKIKTNAALLLSDVKTAPG